MTNLQWLRLTTEYGTLFPYLKVKQFTTLSSPFTRMYRLKFRQPSTFGCSTRLFQSSRLVGFPCLTNSVIHVLCPQTNALYAQPRLPASPTPSSAIRKYSTNQDPPPSSAANSKLPCSRCSRKFANREALDMHVKIKHAQEVSCSICNKPFKSQSDLDQHHLGKHGSIPYDKKDEGSTILGDLASQQGSPEFRCEKCSVGFVSQSALDSHFATDCKPKVSCGKCGKVFETQNDLDKHTESKHLNKEFLCRSCRINFADQNALERHYSSNHKRKISCDKCEKLFKTQDDFDRHIETRHGNQKLRCGKCTRTFVDQQALDEHDKSFHTRTVSCDECDKTFATQGDLNQHTLAKHKPGPDNHRVKAILERRIRLDQDFESEYNDTYQCEECNIVFDTQKEMMSHHLTEHFGCEIQGVGSHEEQVEFLCQLDSYTEFTASQMHPGGFQELYEDDMSWNYPDDWDYYDIWRFRGGDEDYEEVICGDDEETIERLKNLRRSQAMLREGDEWDGDEDEEKDS